MSKEEFEKMNKNKELIESHDRLAGKYGTSYKELERIKAMGKIPIIEVDVQGAIEINR